MIINNNKIKNEALEAISNARDCTYYRILPTGELQINNGFKSYVFLSYVRGNWFVSLGERKSASAAIPKDWLGLFACGNNSLWVPKDNNDVDISTPVIPLDESTRIVQFAFSGKNYDVIIADGSKYSRMISASLPNTQENRAFLILTLTSMIRQYDEKAADDILQFWFRKKDHSNFQNRNHRQIQFEAQENNTAALNEEDNQYEYLWSGKCKSDGQILA